MSKSCVITNPASFGLLPKRSALTTLASFTQSLNRLQGFKSLSEVNESDLLREDVRLRTFLLWPSRGDVRPEDLAKTGMYFTQKNDTVRCFECSLEVTGWTAGQAPSKIHYDRSPYCPMVTNEGSKNIAMETRGSKKPLHVKQKLKARIEVVPRYESEGLAKHYATATMTGRDIHANDLGAGVSSRTRGSPTLRSLEDVVPDMKIEEHRLGSFSGNWSEKFPVKPVSLAKAGFFFKGPHDRVVCAFCNGKVYNWIPGDSPVGEHTRLFPSCPFVQNLNKKPLMKLQTNEAKALTLLGYSEPMIHKAFNECEKQGIPHPQVEQLIDVIYALEEEGEEIGKKTTSKTCSSSLSQRATNGSEELSGGQKAEVLEIQRENESLKASNTCKVCLSAEVHCVFLPCGHLVCCMECSDQVEHCPLCRTRILGSVKAYRA